MPSIVKHFWPCIEVLCASINARKKLRYGDLAAKLGLKLARQEWEGLLKMVADKAKAEVDFDLTWNVVYATGPAKGLGRYFSNDGKPTASTFLDPKDKSQVAKYETTLQEIYKFTYDLRNVEGHDRIIKIPR